MNTIQEIIQEKLASYLEASKEEKGRILDALVETTGCHRQAVIRRLNQLAYRPSHWQDKRRGPKQQYGPAVTKALRDIWELFNEICAERLYPQIGEYVRVLRDLGEWHHSEETTALLLQMKLATVKRRIAAFPQVKRTNPTKPSELKELVPIRSGPWENPAPGYGEVDTVAHCGESLKGDYAYSVQYTDVATTWTLLEAQWNKGMEATKESLQAMRRRCPFPIKQYDFDSGGEFINTAVVTWCRQQDPPLTTSRARPYKKNDHARIEQKNYVNIREFVGYCRYDQLDQLAILKQLYPLVEDYLNFFIGSEKCIKKERVGGKTKRTYDKAKPAYQRIMIDERVDESVKQQLQEKYVRLNPVQLKATINRLQRELFASVRRTKLQ